MPNEEFKLAVTAIQLVNEANVSNQDKLKMYALYKQTNVGDCNTKRSGMFDLKGRAKWDAWKVLNGMSKKEAATGYIALVRALGGVF